MNEEEIKKLLDEIEDIIIGEDNDIVYEMIEKRLILIRKYLGIK